MSATQGPFKVGHDGPSRPIIVGPPGTMLSISKFVDGRWQSYDEEEADCQVFAAAGDLLAACRQLINAPHQEHFAARLNDEEMRGVEMVKAVLAKLKSHQLP